MSTVFYTSIFAAFATLGFCIIFHAPRRLLIPASFVGALGWFAYKLCVETEISSIVLGCFLGSLAVGFCSDIFARVFKDAATMFIIPGIIPLVPGSGMYYTTLAFVQNNFKEAAAVGSQTLFMAGAIALGLLVSGAITRVVYFIARLISSLFKPKSD